MESRKMVLKNLFTGQQWRNKEQTYGHGERGGEGELCGNSNMATSLPCVKQTVGICCLAQETPTGALSQPRGLGWDRDGREGQKGGDVCMPMADSC